MREQTDKLARERDEQVRENERTRTDIKEENAEMIERRRRTAYEIAELEARKHALVDYVNQTENALRQPDVSDIHPDGQDPYEGMPPLEGDSLTEEEIAAARQQVSSTPSNQGGYHPFVNDDASQNVNHDVYNCQPQGGDDVRYNQTRRNTKYNTSGYRRCQSKSRDNGNGDDQDPSNSDGGGNPQTGQSGGGERHHRRRDDQQQDQNPGQGNDDQNNHQYQHRAGNHDVVYDDPYKSYTDLNGAGPLYPSQIRLKSKPQRRQSMSANMKVLYDQNPCIAGLGVDCVSRSADGTEVINWSLAQGELLKSQ